MVTRSWRLVELLKNVSSRPLTTVHDSKSNFTAPERSPGHLMKGVLLKDECTASRSSFEPASCILNATGRNVNVHHPVASTTEHDANFYHESHVQENVKKLAFGLNMTLGVVCLARTILSSFHECAPCDSCPLCVFFFLFGLENKGSRKQWIVCSWRS